MNLSEAKPGSSVRIESIGGSMRLIARYSSMGVIPGTKVDIVKNDANRPLLVYGRDTLMALDRVDASGVLVSDEGEAS